MLDIASSCRTCMKDNVSLVDINDTVKIDDENYLQLAELLIQCTTVEVSHDDGLPQKLCHECTNILQESYNFRYRAEKSQEEFKKILQNIKAEPLEFKCKVEDDDQGLYDSYNDFNYGTECTKPENDEKDYECSKCNKQFSIEKKYLKHLKSHNKSVLSFMCCGKSFSSQTSLNKHLNSKHHKPLECSICNTNFDTETLLLEHMVTHTDDIVKTENNLQEQKFQCPTCDVSYTKHRSLLMHMKKHNKEIKDKVFICDYCGKTFTMKSPLKRHLLIHSEVKAYRCLKCPKRYARHDQYLQHIYTHTRAGKPYECQECKKGFSQLCSLKDHMRIHTGETPYLCSECGKGFANSSNLRQHMMRHTGLKPYACNMCPKTFCTKGQMTSHMTTHTGEHPYKCEKCGAAFTKPNSLKKHSFIHLGVRPFACDSCNMRFTSKDHLKRHQRIHTGEKPYRCKYCDRAFAQSNDLVKHTRTHLGENIYQCTICEMRFRLVSELKLHYPVHFGKSEDSEATQETNIPTDTQPMPLTLEDIKQPINPGYLLNSTSKDLSLVSFKPPTIDKNLPFLTPKPIDNLPVLKPHEKDLLALKQQGEYVGVPEMKGQESDNRITITINGCDKNGVVNDITINIAAEGD